MQHLIPDLIFDSNGYNNLLIAFNSLIRINITGLTFNIQMYILQKNISVHFNRSYSNTTCAISGHELLTLPEHMGSSQVFSGVRLAQSLSFCVVFCRSLFVILLFILLSII